MEKNKQGLPPDYYLRTYKDNGEQRAQWYNRCCVSVDVMVGCRYACTTIVPLPKDKLLVERKWVFERALERARELSARVRATKKKHITFELGVVLDYQGRFSS